MNPGKNLSEAKSHHYVPQCYLKNFKAGEKLYYLNLTNLKKGYRAFAKKCSTTNICTQNYYYKSPEEDYITTFSLNHWHALFIETEVLQSLESEYGQLFSKIVSDDEIAIEDAEMFCDFIIQMKMRNPYHAKSLNIKSLEDAMDIILDEIENEDNPYKTYSPEVKKIVAQQIIETHKADPNLDKKLHLSSLIHSHENEDRRIKYRAALCGLKWHILHAPVDGPTYLTSDNPGFVFQDDKTFFNMKLVGKGFFFLPLSSYHCLAVDLNESEDVKISDLKRKKLIHQGNSGKAVEYVNARSCQLINNIVISQDNELLNRLSNTYQKSQRK